MAGRHSKGGRLTWWRRGQGDAARDRSRSRLAGVTDAGTLIEHLMTGQATPDGRYVAVCGTPVLLASLTVPSGFCPLRTRASTMADGATSWARPANRRAIGVTCVLHKGPRGFTNLVMENRAGRSSLTRMSPAGA
jgi:hypothetical protein